MFWTTELAVSPINSLLEEENISLESLLEQEDILHECKLGNEKLIDFLCKPEVLKQLVTFVTTEPPEDSNEKLRYRYANMACEVLSCEKSRIGELFAADSDLLSILYDKLQSSDPLNPLLASFICKILFSLPQNSSMISNDIHLTRDGFVPSLINHIGTSAVMDLIFKSLARQDSYISLIYMDFYVRQGLVDLLISLFKEDVDPAAQSNSAQLLCDIIRFSREQQTCNQDKAEFNPLLSEIESTSTITKLLNNMFETRTESCLVNGIQVLQALLEYRRYRANLPPKQSPYGAGAIIRNGTVSTFHDIDDPEKITFPLFVMAETILPDLMTPLDIERLTKSVRQAHAAIVPRLEDFHSLLIHPPTKQPIRTTFGLIERPFGATRVEVVHLIRALISSNNPTINKKLTSLKTLPVLMDLFFQYPFNNFLHTQVEQSINCILDNAKSTSPITSPTGGLEDDDDDDKNSVEDEKEGTEKVNEVAVEGINQDENGNGDNDGGQEAEGGGGGGDFTSTPDKSAADSKSDKKSKKSHKVIDEDENVTSLVYQLLVEYNLIGKILDAYQQSLEKQSITKPSYLGHIIKIANHILSTKDVTVVKSCLDQLPLEIKQAWTKWVDETLEDINLKMRSPLVAEPSDSEQNYFSDDMAATDSQLTTKLDIQNMFSNFYSHSVCGHYDTSEDSNLHDETIKSGEEEELLS